MGAKKTILSFLLSLYSVTSLLCATYSSLLRFSHFNTLNSEISHDGISKIMQDSRGFIWIGTFNGLNRYDGSRFTIYRRPQLGLESDFIHSIVEDCRGNLWIGTDKGVSRYIYERDEFEKFDKISDRGTTPQNKITYLYCDNEGKIWIIANYQGCFCYDYETDTLVNYHDEELAVPEYNTDFQEISFRRMVADGNGGFFISKYHNNLYHSEGTVASFHPVRPVNNPEYFDGDEIEQMYMLKGNRLLVASNNHAVSIYDISNNTVRQMFSLPDGVSLVDAFLQDGCHLWLSTTDGLWRYTLSADGKDGIIHLRHTDNDSFSINGNYVMTSYVDRNGGIWVGTKDGGLNFTCSMHNVICKEDNVEGESLRDVIISGFAYDGKSTIWIGTEQGGLLRYDILSSTLERVVNPHIPKTVCPPTYSDGKLWFGSLDGLYCMDSGTGAVHNYGILKREIGTSDPRVYYSFSSTSGHLYVTNTLGIFEYIPDSDTFRQVKDFDGVFVTGMAEDSKGNIWVSSYATGLLEWDEKGRTLIKHFRHGDGSNLPSDKLASVFIDADDNVWVVGFSDGFARLGANGKFEGYTTEAMSSLPSDLFLSMVQDNLGNLWLNSDKGMVQFNPGTGQTTVYDERSGLLDNKMTRACTVLPDGSIFSGSDNGFVHFNPKDLIVDDSASKIVITEMSIGNMSVHGNVDTMDCIRLKADQNSFGFSFSVMGLLSNPAARLKVMLDGYDDDWKDISVSKSVYYFNVPSGDYSLRIMSSGDGMKWSENHSPLKLTVAPIFIASAQGIAAIALAVLLMLAGIFLWVFLWQKRLRKQKEIQYMKKAEEELLNDKMDFFSHVVHEIKTPLTLIQTPLQSIARKDVIDDDFRHDLKVMQNNSDYLTRLVNELLEFVRIERRGYVLDCKPLNLTEKLKSCVFNYTDNAANRHITITQEIENEPLWINADGAALDKILNNLLSNALKHASSYIEIRLKEDVGGHNAIVTVSNDGEVIPQHMRLEVFKPFVQYRAGKNNGTGVGIGLPLAFSLARMHAGDLVLLPDTDKTVFNFSIPLASVAQQDESALYPDGDMKRDGDRCPVILLVDDNAEFRDFMKRKLSQHYSILEAGNSDMAYSILHEKEVDLMITDITMPGDDGLQLCMKVRNDDILSHLPIVILSARTSVQSKIQAMSSGADIYIEKPFDLDYLQSTIKNIVDRRVLMRKAVGSGIKNVDITMFGLPKRDEDFYRQFDSFVCSNLSNSNLSNEMIAEHLCMSVSTMIRKIRKLLDTSPNNYIRVKRLAAAAAMIKDSHGNNITEICYSVGFTNVSYFAKCFKEQYGYTPSEWAAQ